MNGLRHLPRPLARFPGTALAALLALAGPARATEPGSPVAALAEFARTRGIPLEGIPSGDDGAPARPGDRVVLTVTQFTPGACRQWLALLEEDDLTADERRSHPPKEEVQFTTTGRELHYATSWTALQVRLVGPFAPDAAPPPAKLAAALAAPARVVVSRDHLQMGIAAYCEAGLRVAERLRAAGRKDLYHLGRSRPFSAEQLEKGRWFAALISPEEEQVTFGVYFALQAFLEAARSIREFDDILLQTAARPSAWSVAARLGIVGSRLNYDCRDIRVVAAPRAEGPRPSYELPVRLFLNDQLALKATLTVAAPRGPLQTCAGIVGLAAEHPANAGTRLVIRVVAARSAAPANTVLPGPTAPG